MLPRPVKYALGAALLLAAAPAVAGVPVPGTGFDLSGQASVMSDYRFRGVSRSEEDPAAQANLTLNHDSGVYLGARGTTLSGLDDFRLRDPRSGDLGDLEFDLYAGYRRDVGGGLTIDGGVLYYAFAGAAGRADYFEPYASVSYLLGPVEATAGAKYAPSQAGTGDEDMLYLFGEAEAAIPFTPWTLRAHAGREDWGAYGRYWDWSAGASYALGPADIGIRYVDTSLPAAVEGADATLILSVGIGF